MKIAVFFPSNQYVAWSMGRGIPETLKRMGHEVIATVMPTVRQGTEQEIETIKGELKMVAPAFEDLKTCDAVVISGPEHIAPWLNVCYGRYEWRNLGVPRVAWLHESTRREDYNIDFDGISWMADQWCFAGIQDAEFHDQDPFAPGRSHWLPLGVDTEIFRGPENRPEGGIYGITVPGYEEAPTYDLAFVGLLYPKRQVFLRSLLRHNIPPIRVADCYISDINGFDERGTAERLAANYRSIKVFFNLPALSGMIVSKVYEVLACGTFLLTPELPEDFGVAKNMQQFEHKKHLFYYSPSNLAFIAQQLREWTSPEKDAERQAIAEAGCRYVQANHSLKLRLEQMFTLAGIGPKIQVATN